MDKHPQAIISPRDCLALQVTLILALMLALLGTASGQALSKADVLEMQAAGLDKSVLIKKIGRDGISFDMSADTILELKKASVPIEVINALLDAKGPERPGRPTGNSDESFDIRALYQAGKYTELVDKLNAHLKEAPNDYRSRAILVTTLLKLHDRALALTELDRLKHLSDASAATYAQKLDSLIATLDQQEKTKQNLEAALKNYNAAEAEKSVAALPISDAQKRLLAVYLDFYGANFEAARSKLN
jgi:hypothetical protein